MLANLPHRHKEHRVPKDLMPQAGRRFHVFTALTAQKKMKIDESVRVAPPYSKDNEAKKSASLKLRNSWPFWFMSTAHLCEKFLPGSLDLFSKLSAVSLGQYSDFYS